MTVLGAIKFFRDTFPPKHPSPPGFEDVVWPARVAQWESMVDLYVATVGLSGEDTETFRILCEAGVRKKKEG